MDKTIKNIGLLGSIMVSIMFIPQTIHTIRTDKTKDLSKIFLFLSLISSLLMMIYGFYFIIIPVIIANISVFLNASVLLFYSF
jgi:uncharacterized protein with PQ loop repeat